MNDTYWEHALHNTYQEGCSTCFSEKETIKGIDGDFSFENVIKMVGNINKAIYGKNPYNQN